MRQHRQRQHEQCFQVEGVGGQHGEVEPVPARRADQLEGGLARVRQQHQAASPRCRSIRNCRTRNQRKSIRPTPTPGLQSTRRALTLDELRDLLEAVGRPVDYRSLRQVEVALDPWFDLTRTPVSTQRVISAAFRRELEGGPTTGMRPRERGGRLSFRQTWALLRSDPLGRRSEPASIP